MNIRSFVLLSAILFVVTPIYAQDWSVVARLKPGTRVYLIARSGIELKGKVVAVSGTAVDLRVNGRNESIARDHVLTIHSTRTGSRLKRALIGAAAGVGIGAGVGAGVVAATKSDGLAATAGFLYGLPIGAVVGVVTAGYRRGELIYSAN